MTGEPGFDSSERRTIEAQAALFGFPPATVQVSIRRRALSWRVARAARTMAGFVVVALVVVFVPPHAPWAIGALTTGVILARRRWRERFTLELVEGPCPKCGTPLTVKASRLRVPHPMSCEGCHHESSLRIPQGLLEEGPTPATGRGQPPLV